MTSPVSHAVREARVEDVPDLALASARAYYDDALMSWFIPDGARRLDIARRFFAASMRAAVKHRVGTIYTTDDRVGEAHWIPPHRPELPMRAQLRAVAPMLTSLRSVSMPALFEFNRFEAASRPAKPHWYLSGIATDPGFQRRGIATALMAPVLERCDREGVGAFLITQTQANVPFYAKRGFSVTASSDLGRGGPHLWLMWREPRSVRTEV